MGIMSFFRKKGVRIPHIHKWYYFGNPHSFHWHMMGMKEHLRTCELCYHHEQFARRIWVGKYDKQNYDRNKELLDYMKPLKEQNYEGFDIKEFSRIAV